MKFKALKDRNLFCVAINTVSRDEHEKKIERCHRMIKNRSRCCCAMVPFDFLPRMMLMNLLKTVVFCINVFMWKKGVYKTMSTLAIVEGTVLDFRLNFRVLHGELLQTCEGTDNTMTQSTTDAVALVPNCNMQGGMR